MNSQDRTDALWQYLADAAAERGAAARFKVWLAVGPSMWFWVEIVDAKARAVVDDQLLGLIDSANEKEIVARLEGKYAASWKRAVTQVRAMRGKTVRLSTAGTALTVIASSSRTTSTINVNASIKVDPDSLAQVLDETDTTLVRQLKNAPSPNELMKLLGMDAVTQAASEEEQAESVTTSNTSASAGQPSLDDNADEDEDERVEEDPLLAQFNLIFFGPPGTGKSYELAELVHKHLRAKPDNVFRVTFHPEYTYFDFVGTYRPTVGWLGTAMEFRREERESRPVREEPRVYYEFAPGPFSVALAAAAQQPEETVVLIIEEINRGNCAAIFGDVFQLLDRGSDAEQKNFGRSEYDIRPSREWAAWLDHNLKSGTPAWTGGRLRLPDNLYLYATMNTSDQSLFPMDTAFRRRWSMKHASVKPKPTLPTKVPLRPTKLVFWRELMIPLNEKIVLHTGSDDKQMGPWFVKAPTKERVVTDVEFQSKLLFYLWSEVFRDSPEALFAKGIRTYDQLVDTYQKGNDIFVPEVYAAVEPKPPEIVPLVEAADSEGTVRAGGSAAVPAAPAVPAAQ